MSIHPALTITATEFEDPVRLTRRGVIERLADPFLTDHDRWVLGQFARFLDGRAPEPDPRAVRSPRSRQAPPPSGSALPTRVRRANL